MCFNVVHVCVMFLLFVVCLFLIFFHKKPHGAEHADFKSAPPIPYHEISFKQSCVARDGHPSTPALSRIFVLRCYMVRRSMVKCVLALFFFCLISNCLACQITPSLLHINLPPPRPHTGTTHAAAAPPGSSPAAFAAPGYWRVVNRGRHRRDGPE
jgi:hypothetical protein